MRTGKKRSSVGSGNWNYNNYYKSFRIISVNVMSSRYLCVSTLGRKTQIINEDYKDERH